MLRTGWPHGPPRQLRAGPALARPRGHPSGLRRPGCALGTEAGPAPRDQLSLPVRRPPEFGFDSGPGFSRRRLQAEAGGGWPRVLWRPSWLQSFLRFLGVRRQV